MSPTKLMTPVNAVATATIATLIDKTMSFSRLTFTPR